MADCMEFLVEKSGKDGMVVGGESARVGLIRGRPGHQAIFLHLPLEKPRFVRWYLSRRR